MGGVKIDVSQIDTPCYFLSTKDDHIAPWKATYQTTQMVKGDKTFTLAASGHTAGVINHPGKDKYCFWSYKGTPEAADDWLEGAKEQDGSWWPHWQKWIGKHTISRVKARDIKSPLEPAPGQYVRTRND